LQSEKNENIKTTIIGDIVELTLVGTNKEVAKLREITTVVG
jgi:hypothetical protein